MEFEGLSLTELREKAKEAGIKNYTKFKKEELIAVLKENEIEDILLVPIDTLYAKPPTYLPVNVFCE